MSAAAFPHAHGAIMNIQAIGTTPEQASGKTESAPVRARGNDAVTVGSTIAGVQSSGSRAQPSPEQMKQVSDMLNREVSRISQSLRFSVDQQTGKTVIKVMDASTDKVIRQIPSEEAMSIAKALDRVQGLLLKGKA